MPFDTFQFSPITIDAPVAPVLLPHVPSQLLRLALADLRKVERTPGYAIDMSTYHHVSRGTCTVCLAGSVMVGTLGMPTDRSVSTYDASLHNQAALRALSSFRHLPTEHGCDFIGARPISFKQNTPHYEDDPVGFHAGMHALADAFEASGQ